jgi:Ca-activated chloride channel family protein
VSFGNPIWLLALLAIPLALAAQQARRRRARRYAVRFTAVRNLRLAAAGTRSWRRHIPAALLLLALASLTLALARPQKTVAVPVGRASIMMVTDHSLSMEATDVQPDRLSAAKAAARNFIGRLSNQVLLGAVAFSDSPDTVQTPTDDHAQARRVIDGSSPGGATATGEALEVALQALTQAGRTGQRLPSSIILLSDGRTTTGRDPVGVAREAAKLHIPIYTVSLGTESALIPNPGGFGPPVPVPPDPQTLREIAQASGGRAFTAEDDNELSSIYRALGSQLGSKHKKREITAAFALVGIGLLVGAAGASMRLGGRLP